MPRKKRPRQLNERVLYSPQQTQRYKSNWSRYKKGIQIAQEHVVHRVTDEVYRIPSKRSPVGYWQIEKDVAEGEITVEWQGEYITEGEITVEWTGEYYSEGEITVEWSGDYEETTGEIVVKWRGDYDDGETCYIPEVDRVFDGKIIFGCGAFQFMAAIINKLDLGGSYISRAPFAEYYAAFVAVTGNPSNLTWVQLSRSAGSSGTTGSGAGYNWEQYVSPGNFTYGGYIYAVDRIRQVNVTNASFYTTGQDLFDILGVSSDWENIGFLSRPSFSLTCEIGAPSFNPGGDDNKCIPVSGSSGTEYWDCTYSLSAEEYSPSWTVTGTDTIENDDGYTKTLVYCTPPRGDLTGIQIDSIVSVTPIVVEGTETWECTYSLDDTEFSFNWTITGTDTIENDDGYTKTLVYCIPPRDDLTDIHISAIIDVVGTVTGEVTWQCTYSLSEEEFSLVWAITGVDTIESDDGYVKSLVYCTPPRDDLFDIHISDIINVIAIATDLEFWQCTYSLSEEEFSLNWTITGIDTIKNDNGYTKTLVYCTPPRDDLTDIQLHSIVSVTGSPGDNWQCTCPDFSKREGDFENPPYESMRYPRDWQSSDAGVDEWSDGVRRCKHIVAVQTILGEDMPIPNDPPVGEA